jgi:hypothetical protein
MTTLVVLMARLLMIGAHLVLVGAVWILRLVAVLIAAVSHGVSARRSRVTASG